MQNNNSRISGHLHDLTVNGEVVRLTNNMLTIDYVDNIFEPAIQNFRFDEVQYGLYRRDHITIVLIGIADVQYDFWVNAYDLVPDMYRNQLNDYSGKVSFTLVSPTTRQVIVERTFFFSAHFTAHLKNSLRRQFEYYHSEAEVRKRIRELAEFLTTEDMFGESKMYEYPGVKKV